MKKHHSYLVKKVINIKKLVGINYFQLTTSLNAVEECNSFYKFIYVDSGSVAYSSKNVETVLNQGDFCFIPPNTTHSYFFNGVESTHLFMVCFECVNNTLELVAQHKSLNSTEKNLMSIIFSEAKKTFKFSLKKKLCLLETPTFGAQQLIVNYIEALLINIIRFNLSDKPESKFSMNSADFNDKLVNDIIKMLKDGVYKKITLEQVQKSLYYSKTYLNNNFKKITGDSIMHYYRNLKIEEAKKLLKKGESIIAISDKLFFESPNYFCKVFRSVTGLTPTKYKKTIS